MDYELGKMLERIEDKIDYIWSKIEPYVEKEEKTDDAKKDK